MNTPNTPNLSTGQIWTVAKQELSWIQKHERVVIVALVLVAGTFLGNKWLNWEGAQKDAKVAVLSQLVVQDQTQAAQDASRTAQAVQQYQTLVTTLTAQNNVLEGSIAQMASTLKQQQTKDTQMSPSELVQRMGVLVPAAQDGISTTSNGVLLNTTASIVVTQSLEQVPVLQDQLKNETQVAVNNKQALDSANVVIVDKTAQITSLNKSVVDITAQGKAEVAAEKVKTKKAFIKGLKYGFGIGFFAGAYIMHAL
jgi:hypothetical protein